MDMVQPGKTFEEFVAAIRASIEEHAKRKNYTVEGANGNNQLLSFLSTVGIHENHAVGEIIYKAVEMIKAPLPTKKILCEKIAGWAWTIWRELPDE